MKLIYFIIWLSAGAVMGWFASWMIRAEKKPIQNPSFDE
jgi:hypothetical protein